MDPEPEGPVWRKIYDTLREEIFSGIHALGSKLPTEHELAARFGVNRHTVRRALGAISDDGLISVKRGSGAYVSHDVPIPEGKGKAARIALAGNLLPHHPPGRVLHTETVAAGAASRARLGLREGDKVVLVETLYEEDSAPLVYTRCRYPAVRFPDFARKLTEAGTPEEALKAYGVIKTEQHWSRVMAVLPGKRIAGRLGQSEETPALRVEIVNKDMAGQMVEYALVHIVGRKGSLQLVGSVN